MPKFIPDDQAKTFFGDSSINTSSIPKFISDSEMDTLSQPKTKTFDVPDIETPQQKIARYNQEQVVYDQKAKEDNSVLGFLKNFGKGLVENVASSEVGLGKTIAKTFGNQSEDISNQIADTTTTQYNLLKMIRQKEMKGEDATNLKQLYNDTDKQLKEQQARLDEEGNVPTTGQAVGQLGGTALDLLTAGTYGKATQAMKSFKLADKVLPSATALATGKATGLFSKEGAKKVAKGSALGYGYDVAQNLQEGDTGGDVLKPGFGALVVGGLTALPQLSKTAKNLKPDSAKIMQRVGRITPMQQVKFEKMAGQSVGDYLSSRQIFGNEEQVVTKLYDRFTKSKNAGDTAIETLPGTYQFKPVKTMLNDLVERESKVSTEGALSPDFNRINELQKKYKDTGLTMKENNEVKRLFERNVKLNYIKENLPEKVDRANNIDSAVREMMFAKADELGLKNLKEIQKETQLSRTLMDQIGSYAQGRQANNALSLTDAILLAGGDTRAISQYITKKIFSSKRVQSWVAKVARDKGKDVGEIEALFGEAQPLPKRLDAGLNIPAKDTSGIDKAGTEAMSAKYAEQARNNTLKLPAGDPNMVQGETMGLPSRTATGIDMADITNANKQSQSELGKLSEQSYDNVTIREPRSTVVRDAKVISDITSDLPKDDKQGLMEALKANRPQVYKEVIETENADRRSMFDEFKGSSMSEKMNAKEINKAVNLHIGEAFQVLNDPEASKMIESDPQGFIKQTFDKIVMGLEKDAPSASKKIAKIDIESINSISQLGNAIEKALNKGDGFVDKILATVKELPEELQTRKEVLDARGDYFYNSPMNELKKYESKSRPGELPELNGRGSLGKGKFNKEGDMIIDTILGYKNSYKTANDVNDASKAYEKFVKDKKAYLEEVKQLKIDIENYKKSYKSELDSIMESSKPTMGVMDQLKEKIKNTPNKQGGFISTGDNKVTFTEGKEMTKSKLIKAGFGEEAMGFGNVADVNNIDGVPAVAYSWLDSRTLGGFSVAKQFRGKGIAEQYIRELVDEMGGKLDVADPNKYMVDLLKKVGKVTIDEGTGTATVILPSKKANTQGGYIKLGQSEELTTKILKDLEGKKTVSKQYILDATNRGELKQVERDLTRQVLDTMQGDKIDVAEFTQKMQSELLPLKVGKTRDIRANKAQSELKKLGIKFEKDMTGDANIVDKNGDWLEYDELPESTQKLIDIASGSGESFDDIKGYKYENITLPDELRGKVKNYKENIYESPIKTSAGNVHFSGKTDNYFGHTRIEDMADNKTRRVIEVQSDLYQKGNLENEVDTIAQRELDLARANGMTDAQIKRYIGVDPKEIETRNKEVAKLKQYNDPTAHFRMIREEIQKASADGKTKLQFPTGETAMKIEGLGTQGDGGMMFAYNGIPVEPQQLKVGREIYSEASDQDWVITETLGGGKFRAISKEMADKTDPEAMLSTGRAQGEMFDISGEIDTNNPIYKFYEKDVQKYLNKYGGKKVIDDKGVSWIEIPITKNMAEQKVEAFGKVLASPLFIGAGVGLGLAGASKAMKKDSNEKIPQTMPINATKEMPAKEVKETIEIPDVIDDSKTYTVNLTPRAGSFVPKDWLKVMIAQESSNGKDKTNAKGDAGKYGYLVGFTKGTLEGIKEQAKTSQRYKNLLAKLSFNTPQEAIDSAEAYAHHLMRDFGSKGEKDGTTPKNIDAVELYKAYNGGGSAKGVKLFAEKMDNVNKITE